MADHGHGTPDDGAVHVHIHSTKLYAGILGALLFLTVITVAVSYVDIDGFLAMGREVEGVGAWNLTVAVLVATMKAALVVTFFMHLKDDSRFNALVFLGGLLFVGVFFAYTLNDTMTRGETGDAFNGVHVDPERGTRAPGGISGPIAGQDSLPGIGGGAAPAPAGAPAAPAAAPAAGEGAPAEPNEASGAETPAEAAATDEEDDLPAEAEALADEAEAGEEVVEEAADAVGVEPDVEPAAPAE